MSEGDGYNANKISTIVDLPLFIYRKKGYNANKISTIVDAVDSLHVVLQAIMPIKFLLL